MGRFVIAAFKPKQGMQEQLAAVVEKHWRILRAEGLVTERPRYAMQAADGTVIEVFEWLSAEAIERAHETPAVLALWAEFEAACEYVPLASLGEAQHPFSEFSPLSICAQLQEAAPSRHPSDGLPRQAGRAVLRRMRRDDLPAFHAYRQDAVVGRYQGWTPMSEAECLAFIDDVAVAPLFEPGAWAQVAIARADDDTLIGDVGLFVAQDLGFAEVGFTVSPSAQGQGLGSAAVAAAIGLLFEQTRVPRILGITDARNIASVRLLERVGMSRIEVRETVFKGEPCTEWVYAKQR